MNPTLMKPLRHQNRPVISYVPRVEPAPPDHADRMEGYDDVWVLKGKYVAFVMSGDHFRRSPVFSSPEAAQRWANQLKQDEI
ncbi:cell division activator CedA [Cronobacter turicensis]|uniref:cell division activator CedA n=1 Tax=Cronobacter turicensis TaxID=413502 RepID=UPI0024ADBCCC|nr:cell division activator CedA [Cronobacter turicensis]MDI6431410.1 cell division activator CedA [Cronobacter turicensis]MDK1186057.1 cell division activator CedA [Cronobacter turicensis]MDK1204427.1 cell division activator CedA [Cronobacter turicensis]MDK1215221.1 cell division activator CedA [Cronobacter turicensis]MDK1219936.1 cell division activator CedA [Cronobacter turicensis]